MTAPLPFKVVLSPHDPRWSAMARDAGAAFAEAVGSNVVFIHHIGSTAIPGISAKPILDLIPVVRSLSELDRRRGNVEAMGYEWWDEFGLPGRRYCTKNDPRTGRRVIHLHCFEVSSNEIDRHLAFRDYLRERPDIARAYEEEKVRCRNLHPDDSHTYSDCKNEWIKTVEAEALAWYRESIFKPRGNP